MPQISRPISDVSDSGWTPQPITPKVNELTPDDSTYVSSTDNPPGDTFEVKLAAMCVPEPGSEVLTVRLKKTAVPNVPVTVYLVQGSTIIGQWSVTPTQSFTSYSFTLTSAQMSQITNYADLRVRVKAGTGTTTGCNQCPGGAPLAWQVSFSSITNVSCTDCTNFNTTFLLSYQGGCTWQGIVTVCGSQVPIRLQYNGTAWELDLITGSVRYTAPANTWNCLGANTMSFQTSAGNCAGWPATVTVSPG